MKYLQRNENQKHSSYLLRTQAYIAISVKFAVNEGNRFPERRNYYDWKSNSV